MVPSGLWPNFSEADRSAGSSDRKDCVARIGPASVRSRAAVIAIAPTAETPDPDQERDYDHDQAGFGATFSAGAGLGKSTSASATFELFRRESQFKSVRQSAPGA